MEAAAGLADHGFVTGVRIVSGLVRQPVLHVHAGPRTFENEVGHRPANLGPARLFALISINFSDPGWLPAGSGAAPSHLIQCFRDQANLKDRLLGRVEKFHLPFAVFLEFAGNAA